MARTSEINEAVIVNGTGDELKHIPMEPVDLTVQRTGLFHGKPAIKMVVFGQRDLGYSSTTTFQDLSNYLDTTQALNNEVAVGTTYYLRSSSATDTAAGAGAQRVRITWLDSTGAQQVSDIALNGTTGVSLGAGYTFFNACEVSAYGVNGISAGDITISTVAGAPTVAQKVCQIDLGTTQCRLGRYKVPIGHTVYLQHWVGANIYTAGGAGNGQDVRIRATTFMDGSTSTVLHTKSSMWLPYNTVIDHDMPFTKIPAGGIINLATIPMAVAATNRCDGHFAFLLVQD